jgi:hypothetical protein
MNRPPVFVLKANWRSFPIKGNLGIKERRMTAIHCSSGFYPEILDKILDKCECLDNNRAIRVY